MNIIAQAVGNDGQLEIYEDRIVILRRGIFAMLSHGFKGNKEVPLTSLSSVELKEANFFGHGYIEFIFSGSSGSRKENKIVFNKKQQPAFIEIKNKLFELMNDAQSVGTN